MKRDEVERLEAAVRDANPVPSAVDLINSEEAAAVTLLVQQRRRTMTTTPTHTASHPTGPPLRPRRSMVWAFAAGFVLVVLVVGAAALVLRGRDLPVTDAPAPTVATIPEQSTPSTDAAAAAGSTRGYGTEGWEWFKIIEPWVGSVVDFASLPRGGFVVAATDEWAWTPVESSDGTEWQRVAGAVGEWSVFWSPDGIEWRDADPQREVTVLPLTRGFMGSRPQVVTTVGGQVVVLDRTVFGIRIGDLETQTWDAIEFDTSDLVGEIGLLAVASNETEVLVVGYEDDYGGAAPAECGEAQSVVATRYVTWLVDPRSGEVQRSSLPVGHEDVNGPAGLVAGGRVCGESYGSVAWFKDQWVLNLADLWFVSADGVSWTYNPTPAGSEALPATLLAGPDTLLAEVWNGLWYSENGTDWVQPPEPDSGARGPSEAAYSPSFGYVATPWSQAGLYVSTDGREWHHACCWPDIQDLTASGDRILALDEFGRAYLIVYKPS